MSKYNSTKFEEALENGADPSTLLRTLDKTIIKIVNSALRGNKIRDGAITKDDIVQEVRIFLWEKKKLVKLFKMKDASYQDIFKYVTTLIKNSVYRTILEVKCVNPRKKSYRKIKDNRNVTISRINLEFFGYSASYPIESLIDAFEKKCEKVLHADKVFKFLTSVDCNEEDYAGLSPTVYYRVCNKMKQLAKEVASETPYE